jgi:basic membrane protein A
MAMDQLIQLTRRLEMKDKKIWRLIALIAILAMILAACQSGQPSGDQPAADEPVADAPSADEPAADEPVADEPAMDAPTDVQVCVMYAVGLDSGWDRTFDESFQRVIADPPLGLTVKEMLFTEGLWGDEAEASMREFAESGECDIIWPHGGYNDNIDNLKADYPEIMWVEVGSGVLEYGDNNYHFWLRCHEPSYLMGVLAGHLSESNVFGAVGTFPASDVNDSINAFYAGAESVQEEIVRKVAFTNSWYDPVAANTAAGAQIAAGATHIDMYAETFDTCAEEGAICYGSYNDYSEYYPTTALASFVAKWDAAVIWAIEEWYVAVTGDGFDAPEAPTFTMTNGDACSVGLSALASDFDPEVLEAFEAAKQGILDGTIQVELDETMPESD